MLQETPLFAAFAELIALDMNMAIRSIADVKEIFENLVCQLKSAQHKLAPVKTSRWFSWHQCCHDQFQEYWSMRLLLTHEFGDQDVDTATNRTFARLRDDASGMKLALHCTSWRTWLSVKVLWLGGQPLWTWYTDQVKNVKCPEKGLGHLRSLAGGNWLQDSQFRCLVKVLPQSEEFIKVGKFLELAKQQLGPNPETCMGAFVEELFFYCT